MLFERTEFSVIVNTLLQTAEFLSLGSIISRICVSRKNNSYLGYTNMWSNCYLANMYLAMCSGLNKVKHVF